MALELNKPIFQIVGYQNSGKTTLMTKLIKRLSAQGIKVAVLKHHGHGGQPLMNDAEKDSGKYRDAGAQVTGVEGEGMLQLHAEKAEGWTLNKLLKIYEMLPGDLILIEGYKHEAFPKVVLLRSQDDLPLLQELKGIELIITWSKVEESLASVPIFHIEEEDKYLSWLVQELTRRIT